jgi:hypothetical protein
MNMEKQYEYFKVTSPVTSPVTDVTNTETTQEAVDRLKRLDSSCLRTERAHSQPVIKEPLNGDAPTDEGE